MSDNAKYHILNTYYEKEEVLRIIHELNNNDISYRIIDKSKLTNFRVPSSTYVEIDLLIRASDYEKAFNLLIEKD